MKYKQILDAPEFRNESGLSFTDISSEEYRTYVFTKGETITIKDPLKLNVSKTGGHRVWALAAPGRAVCYYIAPKWLAIQWEAKPTQPHFVK